MSAPPAAPPRAAHPEGAARPAGARPAPAHARDCAECGGALLGPYCHGCGAPRADLRPLRVSRFARELAHEVTSADSVTVATFRALLRHPGLLTAEYLAGRTRRYLSPLRLFLLTCGVLLLAASLAPRNPFDTRPAAAALLRVGPDSPLGRQVARAAARRGTSPAEVTEAVAAAWGRYVSSPLLRVFDPLLTAGLLALLLRGRRRGYAEHVVFALHVLAFNALLGIATGALHAAAGDHVGANRAATLVHWLAIGSYFAVAVRRVYGGSRPATAARAVGFVAGTQAVMYVIPLAGLAVALLQVLLP